MEKILGIDAMLDTLTAKVAEKIRADLSRQDNETLIKPRLLSIEQAAAYLGRTEDAIRHTINTAKITTVRSDRRIFLDAVDLDHWIESNK
jgi:helix-turn-helix protein